MFLAACRLKFGRLQLTNGEKKESIFSSVPISQVRAAPLSCLRFDCGSLRFVASDHARTVEERPFRAAYAHCNEQGLQPRWSPSLGKLSFSAASSVVPITLN